MSVGRCLEAWEEMQRHGQDLADRLAQGFTGLLQSHINPPPFAWPSPQKNSFDPDHLSLRASTDGVSAIFDIGNRFGQAGAEFGACINGVVQQFFRRLPGPFWQDDRGAASSAVRADMETRRRNEAFLRGGGGVEVAKVAGTG